MDTETVIKIIGMISIAEENTKQDPKYSESFECNTKEEYQAYLKGHVDALQGVLNHLQKYIEGELNASENNTGV